MSVPTKAWSLFCEELLSIHLKPRYVSSNDRRLKSRATIWTWQDYQHCVGLLFRKVLRLTQYLPTKQNISTTLHRKFYSTRLDSINTGGRRSYVLFTNESRKVSSGDSLTKDNITLFGKNASKFCHLKAFHSKKTVEEIYFIQTIFAS